MLRQRKLTSNRSKWIGLIKNGSNPQCIQQVPKFTDEGELQSRSIVLNGSAHPTRRKRSRSSGRRRRMAAITARSNSVLMPIEEKDELSGSSWSLSCDSNDQSREETSEASCSGDQSDDAITDSIKSSDKLRSDQSMFEHAFVSNQRVNIRIDWMSLANHQFVCKIKEAQERKHKESIWKQSTNHRLAQRFDQTRRFIRSN